MNFLVYFGCPAYQDYFSMEIWEILLRINKRSEGVGEGGFSLIWYLTKFSMKLNERLGL